MIRTPLLILAAFVVSAPAFAQDVPAEATPPEKPKKICRYEGSTGSVMRKRVCHTAAEWKAIETVNAANARTTIDRNNLNRPAVGGGGI